MHKFSAVLFAMLSVCVLDVLQYAALASQVTMTSEIEATVAGEHWPTAGHALLPADEPASAAAAEASSAAAASAAAALASAQVCCKFLAVVARPTALLGHQTARAAAVMSTCTTRCLGDWARCDREVPAAVVGTWWQAVTVLPLRLLLHLLCKHCGAVMPDETCAWAAGQYVYAAPSPAAVAAPSGAH
jgi:hypothetical protein